MTSEKPGLHPLHVDCLKYGTPLTFSRNDNQMTFTISSVTEKGQTNSGGTTLSWDITTRKATPVLD